MALATQCPHCGTLFRVAADQLKLRGGIVRCGACQQVFDGNSALVDLAAVAPPAAPPSAPVSAAESVAEPASESTSESTAAPDDEAPVYTLELDRTFAPHGILPGVEAPGAAHDSEPATMPEALSAALPEPALEAPPAAAPEPEPEPEPGPVIDAEAKPAPEPDLALPATTEPTREHTADSDGPSTLLLRESSGGSPPIASSLPASPRNRAAEARARRVKAAPPRSDTPPPKPAPPKPPVDEPEFVRSTRQREASGKTVRIALAAGSALLLLALALQAAMSFRDVLAARYPGLRPALVATCDLLGCSIGLLQRPEQLVIETGELITLGGNAYTFSTVLRNQGDLALAWPSLELTLNDADDNPLVRRVFAPRDYAGQAAGAPLGFGARAEQPVRIHFRLEGVQPSGYHIAVFYP